MTDSSVEEAINLLSDRVCRDCRHLDYNKNFWGLKREYIEDHQYYCTNPKHKKYGSKKEPTTLTSSCSRWKELNEANKLR